MLFVPRDAVLAGSHGQLTDGGLFGKVELASFAAHDGGITQDLLRLLFLPNERACAFVFLSTAVGQRLLKSTAVGTSIPSMRLDLLGQLPYPPLGEEMRTRVTTFFYGVFWRGWLALSIRNGGGGWWAGSNASSSTRS
jgi:hypothetical protein